MRGFKCPDLQLGSAAPATNCAKPPSGLSSPLSRRRGSRECRRDGSMTWCRRWGCRASRRAKSPNSTTRSTSACSPSSSARSAASGRICGSTPLYLKVRESGRIVSVAAIFAVAVNTDGGREIVGLHIGPSEAEPFWTTFLRDLVRRGLKGLTSRRASTPWWRPRSGKPSFSAAPDLASATQTWRQVADQLSRALAQARHVHG